MEGLSTLLLTELHTHTWQLQSAWWCCTSYDPHNRYDDRIFQKQDHFEKCGHSHVPCCD